ncbi:MAG: IF-2-associated domain-containing protein, partial [Magnetospirillum sp.]|nr:IF-2-associated domain-containing protein [Magnetospirillum sp.]
MSDSKDQERKTPLKLSSPGKLELKKTVETGQVRQSFSHGRSKVVTVEVRKKRTFAPGAGGAMHEVRDEAHGAAEAELAKAVAVVEAAQQAASAHDLTNNEKAARAKALEVAMKAEAEARARAEEEAARRAVEEEEAREAAEAEAAAAPEPESLPEPEPEAAPVATAPEPAVEAPVV